MRERATLMQSSVSESTIIGAAAFAVVPTMAAAARVYSARLRQRSATGRRRVSCGRLSPLPLDGARWRSCSSETMRDELVVSTPSEPIDEQAGSQHII